MDNKKDGCYCEACGKKLRGFTSRFDWNKRKLHMSCWKKREEEKTFQIMMDDYLKDKKNCDL